MEILATYVPGADSDPFAELAQPPAAATAVEIRVDLLPQGLDLRALVEAVPVPVLLTLRSRAEGGHGADDVAARRDFVVKALSTRAPLIDLEAARDRPLLASLVPRERAVVSAHFPGVPEDLAARVADLLASGARFVKVVPHATTLEDVLVVVRAAGSERVRRSERRGIVFATGESGVATRMLGPLLGAGVAYAAWSAARRAAPGQLAADELRAAIGELTGPPQRLFAVLTGAPLQSLSPRMHNAAYRAEGLPHLFVPLAVNDVGELDELLRPAGETAFDGLGLAIGGWAVTMPWKGEAARRCSVLAPRAERAGAVNTVIPRPGKVLGDCTDIDGITRALVEAGFEVAGSRALVLGAGGAARAAAVALDMAGAEVAVAARNPSQAEVLAGRLGIRTVGLEASDAVDLVVNATPAGRAGGDDPFLDGLRLRPGAMCVDLPYGEVPTALEHLAAVRGWSYVPGREVLLWQGVAQFAAMNGVAPPVAAMAAAIGLAGSEGGGAAAGRRE